MRRFSKLSFLMALAFLTSCSTPVIYDPNGFGSPFFDNDYRDNYYIDNGYFNNGHYGKGPLINGGNAHRYYTTRGEGNDYLEAKIAKPIIIN